MSDEPAILWYRAPRAERIPINWAHLGWALSPWLAIALLAFGIGTRLEAAMLVGALLVLPGLICGVVAAALDEVRLRLRIVGGAGAGAIVVALLLMLL